jgi:tetratricopeptide (TPR) repeat protein
MDVGAARPWLGVAGFVLLLGLGLSGASWAQSDELSVLNRQVVQLYQAGKYSDASSVAERALALSEQLYGPSHPNVAVALNDLAELYRAEGRYADAEPITRRALAIRETALGRDDPIVAQSLNLLAELCRAQGRYVEAEPLLKRAVAIYESAFGPDSLDVAASLK